MEGIMKPIRWLMLALSLVMLSACVVAPGGGYYHHRHWHHGYYR
jgi:hypothetical protein